MFKTFHALLGALVLGALALPAAQAGQQDFILHNKTGYTIAEVYVSPVHTDNWEEDILGRDVLPADEAVEIQFSRREDSCNWDLRVVYDDGEDAEWENFDLCKVSSIEIFYDRRADRTWAEYE